MSALVRLVSDRLIVEGPRVEYEAEVDPDTIEAHALLVRVRYPAGHPWTPDEARGVIQLRQAEKLCRTLPTIMRGTCAYSDLYGGGDAGWSVVPAMRWAFIKKRLEHTQEELISLARAIREDGYPETVVMYADTLWMKWETTQIKNQLPLAGKKGAMFVLMCDVKGHAYRFDIGDGECIQIEHVPGGTSVGIRAVDDVAAAAASSASFEEIGRENDEIPF